MPEFDLRGIKVGKYNNSGGTISYSNVTSVGDAMNVNLELKYAEGRLYAESSLAEYMRKATGGTISIGTKYIPAAAQKIMYGARDGSRTVGSSPVSGLKYGAKDESAYVGVAFYAPDMIDGVQKYTCMFVTRALFGLPGWTLTTLGESITFNTPTTTGEFLPDHSTTKELIETGVCDTEADATAWVSLVLGEETT